MRYKLFCAGCMMAVAVIGAGPAYAGNLHGFGCGTAGTNPPATDATSAPGNSATSPGSTHNEPNTVSVNGGKGGAAYNAAGAPSNYDTSCGRVTANGTGTPIQTTPSGTSQMQVPNNSQATRTTEGVTSHMGKGAH